MRFAFVTTEFATTLPSVGGLSTYVARMAGLLTSLGHEVEVFVPGGGRADSIAYGGYRVTHVAARTGYRAGHGTGPGADLRPDPRPDPGPDPGTTAARMLGRLLRRLHLPGPGTRLLLLAQARQMAAAVEAAHAQNPFDVVHSADHLGIGAAIARRPDRLLVVRCSSARELYFAADGRTDPGDAAQMALEERAIARADLAFAPSHLAAQHYRAKLGRAVAVIRPPAYLEHQPLATAPDWLPPRYLLHFAGYLIPRKGSDLVTAALALALRDAPDMRLVMVGRVDFARVAALLAPLGDLAHQVLLLYPQPKPVLYAMIRGAVAVVLPSRVDNLPNTAIESLMLGAPVIASLGSSLEELVEDGVTGTLVPNGDVAALAAAMLHAWRGGAAAAVRPSATGADPTPPAPHQTAPHQTAPHQTAPDLSDPTPPGPTPPGPARPDWTKTAQGAAFAPAAAAAAYLDAVAAAQGQRARPG